MPLCLSPQSHPEPLFCNSDPAPCSSPPQSLSPAGHLWTPHSLCSGGDFLLPAVPMGPFLPAPSPVKSPCSQSSSQCRLPLRVFLHSFACHACLSHLSLQILFSMSCPASLVPLEACLMFLSLFLSFPFLCWEDEPKASCSLGMWPLLGVSHTSDLSVGLCQCWVFGV